MTDLPLDLLALPPLAIAAGVDVYLTLLFIGVAAATGLWATPMPGALGDLDSPVVLVMVGVFYVAEVAAERFPPAALAWNALHAIIRPVSGALLALLLLDDRSLSVAVAGALVGGLLASLAHGVRSGAWALRGLGGAGGPSPLLISMAEDAVVLGAVSLTLDAPVWALGASLALLLGVAPFTRSLVRAFTFTIRLGVERLFRTLARRRWRRADELPAWVVDALSGDPGMLAKEATLRGCPAAAWRLAGAPRFAIGWMVVRAGSAEFLFGRRRRSTRVALEGSRAIAVHDRGLFRRIGLESDGARASLFVGSGGPATESLSGELGVQ